MKYLLLIFFVCYSLCISAQQCPVNSPFPFTTDSTHLKIWNKSEYIPFFVKGCNLSVAVPGKYPGDLAVTRQQYGNWLGLIKEAGFNSIRLYTLHFPDFYEVLDSFNLANPKNPLFVFQGVWLEEQLPGYNDDLNYLDSSFSYETKIVVDCIHGNRVVTPQSGKAFGTYSVDVSKWTMGYIIAREISPDEVLTTNQLHATDTFYGGLHFSIHGNPTEVFVTRHLDELVTYENAGYQTQRPVSCSNWPTLDPLYHPAEVNRMEDTASIDLSNIDYHLAPAGFFASMHAYPYYPNFISNDSFYQTYSDAFGPDSYIGYLTALKNHYNRMPLIIAETGTPSSWGTAHYSSSGMDHGGMSEQKQGENLLRIFNNTLDAGCGGAMNFAFIDEWFKRTWITDPVDYDPARRKLWHNIMGAEQNFGLVGFRDSVVMQNWKNFGPGFPINNIKAAADYEFFHIGLALNDSIQIPDDIWISLDTYRSNLGESILPNGDTVQNRAEFVLHITNYSAQLFVTEAYDIFRIWSNTSSPAQMYHSTRTNGAPWVIERWENNIAQHQIQYVGDLKVNSSYLPPSSTDAITIYPDSVHIRLPWSLLYFVDPSKMKVFNDSRATPAPEDTVSDGIQISVSYHNQFAVPSTRFTWNTWDSIPSIHEYRKASYDVVKNGLPNLNNPAIPVSDSYTPVDTFPYIVSPVNGVLKNDFDLDGIGLQALIIGNALHGSVSLNTDGSFTYVADAGYIGNDYFEYCIFDGHNLSQTAFVCLDVINPLNGIENINQKSENVFIYPNPANDFLNIKCELPVTSMCIFNSGGKLVKEFISGRTSLNISELPAGNYFLKTAFEKSSVLNRFAVVK